LFGAGCEQEDTMQGSTKSAIAAFAIAAVAAVTANALYAHVGSAAHVMRKVVTPVPASSPAYADWHAVMTGSFGDRFLGRGSKVGPVVPTHMFESMKKL
jgi:hypothetical protein